MAKKEFLGFEEIAHEVREVWKITTQSGKVHIDKPQSTEHRFIKHINAVASGNIITFSWWDWQGNNLLFEPVTVKLSGDVNEQIIELTQPTLELQGTGLVINVETINPLVLNASIEVTL